MFNDTITVVIPLEVKMEIGKLLGKVHMFSALMRRHCFQVRKRKFGCPSLFIKDERRYKMYIKAREHYIDKIRNLNRRIIIRDKQPVGPFGFIKGRNNNV